MDALLERLRERAREEGRREGAAEARRTEAGALATAAEELAAFREHAADSLARTAVDLAVEIARQLVRAEVSRGRHDMEALVREALRDSAAGRARCVVHLHPEDALALADVSFRSGTEVHPDVEVARGDVHVETHLGLLARELDGALEAIGARLREDLDG